MKPIIAVCAAALAAALAIAGPASAAPLRVVIHPTPYYVPPSAVYDTWNGYGDYYGGFFGNPQDRYYDPAGASPDSRYYGPPAVDMMLARTLDRNGETMLGHAEICQARHATYSVASNTFYGHNGIPVVCQE